MIRLLTVLCLLAITFSCKTPEPREAINVSSGSVIQESVERNKALIAQEENAIKAIIALDTTAAFKASSQGFWYAKTVQDTVAGGNFPKFGDQLQFSYQIEDLEGTVIYNQSELGIRRYAMDQEQLISGLREGLKLMEVGETMILYLPSYKAYGYYGDENRIGTNVPLRIRVTLLQLESKTSQN